MDFDLTSRKLIYPDLRTAYKQHDAMLLIMTNAIQACYELSKQGGGQPQGNTVPNVFEQS